RLLLQEREDDSKERPRPPGTRRAARRAAAAAREHPRARLLPLTNRWAPPTASRLTEGASRGRSPARGATTIEAIKGSDMLMEQTLEKLNAMKLFGMAKALRDWHDAPKKQSVEPQDFVGFLADAEWVYRENRRLHLRLIAARFKMPA